MSLMEILNKECPVPYKRTRDMSESEYMKLVDRNAKLVDKMKEQQERIDKTINILELSAMNKGICTQTGTDTIQSALLVLKGENNV